MLERWLEQAVSALRRTLGRWSFIVIWSFGFVLDELFLRVSPDVRDFTYEGRSGIAIGLLAGFVLVAAAFASWREIFSPKDKGSAEPKP